MPRLVIDARSVVAKKSGIGNYVDALIRHMAPLSGDLELSLLRHPEARESGPLVDGVPELFFRGETKSTATVFSLARSVDLGGFDLYHSPADLVPLGIPIPWVVTIHDLMWVEAPRLASAFLPVRIGNGLWYSANIRRSVAGAERVIAISEATRQAISRHYPRHVHKTSVIHHGIEHSRFEQQLAAAAPRELLDDWVPAGARYSLIVGQGSPYKNHPAMIRAFVEAFRDDPGHKLVLLRRFARVDREMSRLLERPEVKERVLPISFVPDEVLVALYRHARMLLFASLYEGFGLPGLEAMALGTPVLASTAPAVQEVTGPGAIHAVPDSHVDLVRCMRRLDGDAKLRARLTREASEWVKRYQWDDTARKTLAVYRAALSANQR
ncbi:MAG: glycosyltransferase family 4 protein [Myxococcales bacterium]|nr:glycosyltransferase family 4 protein [Myxococcales bacterium]